MDWLLYCIARVLFALLQALPLRWVARIGRVFGGLFYWIDKRHRRVAIKNLAACFPSRSPQEIHALAKENFRRIGENWGCAVKVASMPPEQIAKVMELAGFDKVTSVHRPEKPASLVFAIGHFGNFELFAAAARAATGYRAASTYRALRSERLNGLMLKMREHSGCLFFERRLEGAALRAAMRDSRIVLGLLADQHAGTRGVRLPFFGRDCATSKAPAVFALRFQAPLHTAFCFRTELGKWRVEFGEEIPTTEDGVPRSVADIMLDVNRAFEAAVRRDPANWFWVHNRWKLKAAAPVPPAGPPRANEQLDAELDAN
jgi:lauroyl/myristoyl acyltransferase